MMNIMYLTLLILPFSKNFELPKNVITVPFVLETSINRTQCMTCDVKIDGKSYVALIDTGAMVNIADFNQIGRDKIVETLGKSTAFGFTGEQISEIVSIRGFQIGDIDTRTFASGLQISNADLTKFNENRKTIGLRDVQMILGLDFLVGCNAVIDCTKRQIKFTLPYNQIVDMIQGTWKCKFVNNNGSVERIDNTDNILSIKNNYMELEVLDKKFNLKFHGGISQKYQNAFQMVLFEELTELDDNFRYLYVAVGKVEEDKLTLVVNYNSRQDGRMPDSFIVLKGSGLVLYEFERVKEK